MKMKARHPGRIAETNDVSGAANGVRQTARKGHELKQVTRVSGDTLDLGLRRGLFSRTLRFPPDGSIEERVAVTN